MMSIEFAALATTCFNGLRARIEEKDFEIKNLHILLDQQKKTIEKLSEELNEKKLYSRSYQKRYRKEILGQKPREGIALAFEISFISVLNEVKNGLTIDAACKKSNITRTKLYKRMTTEQHSELINAKYLYSCVDVEPEFTAK